MKLPFWQGFAVWGIHFQDLYQGGWEILGNFNFFVSDFPWSWSLPWQGNIKLLHHDLKDLTVWGVDFQDLYQGE